MALLVSIDEVKAMLRLDGDSHDGLLTLLIPAASGAVLNYLKSGADAFVDASGEAYNLAAVPFEVRAATVLMIGHLMRNPDNNVEGAFDRGYLPMPVTALLYPLRDPALA